MATFTKYLLSGSSGGRPICVAGTVSPGGTIHTAVTGTDDLDEIWLWAVNNHTADVALSIEYGGTVDPDDIIQVSIPAQNGLVLVVPGLVLQDSLVVGAFADTTNVVSISGFVNRITV